MRSSIELLASFNWLTMNSGVLAFVQVSDRPHGLSSNRLAYLSVASWYPVFAEQFVRVAVMSGHTLDPDHHGQTPRTLCSRL